MDAREFREWRERLGLTQTQVAEFFKVSRNTVQNWETGAAPISRAVDMGAEFWEHEHRKRDDYGPVTLVYADGSLFVNPYGPRRLAMMQREPYKTNAEALARVRELWGRDHFHNPFIVGDKNDFVWNAVELARHLREHVSVDQRGTSPDEFMVMVVRLPLPREPLGDGAVVEGAEISPPRSYATLKEAVAHARELVQRGYRVAISGPSVDWNEEDVRQYLASGRE